MRRANLTSSGCATGSGHTIWLIEVIVYASAMNSTLTVCTSSFGPVLKDPKRVFGSLEREIIYFRDIRKCAVPTCGGEVAWDDAEIHHVEEHAQGGWTVLENGVLVHRACHPKGSAAQEFAKSWKGVSDET